LMMKRLLAQSSDKEIGKMYEVSGWWVQLP
jgi:hypothetical protein